jgi:transcription elongation factor Elf1
MSDWSHEGLWAKAVLYAAKATDERRNGPLYPLWSMIALEFVARSCLAKVHPSLLADTMGDHNVLHACGYPSAKARSIPAGKVFDRCRVIVNGFTEAERQTSMLFIDRRNTELHSGSAGFADFGTEKWLTDYFRICRLLLTGQGKTLQDLLGVEEARSAEKMIAAGEEKIAGIVKKAIAEAKERFATGRGAQQVVVTATEKSHAKSVSVICPACGRTAQVRGERVSVKKIEVDELFGTLQRRTVILPTSFECLTCELSLKGHAALHIAGIGGNREVIEEVDPAEFFGIEQPSDEDMQRYAEKYMADLAADAAAEYYREDDE